MKKLLIVSMVLCLLSMTVMANLPGKATLANNEISFDKNVSQSFAMGNMEMSNVQGGSLWKCLLGIGLCLTAPLDTLAGWMVYGCGIDYIMDNCIFV